MYITRNKIIRQTVQGQQERENNVPRISENKTKREINDILQNKNNTKIYFPIKVKQNDTTSE